jgi:hypothetical protein
MCCGPVWRVLAFTSQFGPKNWLVRQWTDLLAHKVGFIREEELLVETDREP